MHNFRISAWPNKEPLLNSSHRKIKKNFIISVQNKVSILPHFIKLHKLLKDATESN